MRKKIIYSTLLLPLLGSAQTVNTGDLSVSSGTEVSTYFDFKNESSGNVLNDGDFYFYGHYQNEGLFSYTTNSTTGYVVFEGLMGGLQNISGASPSSFYDVLFNKAGGEHAFHLTNDIENAGTVNLTNGVVWMDKENGGAFVFLKGAKHINTSDRSHVNGEVTKIGNETFKYPVGDGGYYRFAGISAPATLASNYSGEYLLENSNDQYPHSSRSGVIDLIDNKEYWIIEQGVLSDQTVAVTLSWDERTTPAELIGENAQHLHVVRWDTDQQLWVDEGGIVDFGSKTVTTLTNVEGFGVFTLARIKPDIINPGDVVIYDGVTPNDDGLNDYFIIDNIWLYPQNKVRVFNRWGREVFYTENYDSSGNVFRGIAEGKGVINKGEQLPSGTYYYIVEYFYSRDGVNQWVKKVGHLHLETE